VTWGGRVNLLTGEEASDPATWVRVGGSIAMGAVGALAAWRAAERPSAWTSAGLAAFAAWNVMIWGSSLVTMWQGDYSTPFKAVHTGLAAGSLALAGTAAGVVVRSVRAADVR
jgi:hypothetical protein